jgi:hypothetical protein
MLRPEDPCPNCGGALAVQTGPGRRMPYRGESGYDVPADIAVPVCTECGADWMDSASVALLGTALEVQRAARIKARTVEPRSAITVTPRWLRGENGWSSDVSVTTF